jgi:poly(A) polymerase
LIKRFIRKVFRLGTGREPVTLPVEKHGVRREAISHGARKVCSELQAAGFSAYVVGGAVRDLLMGVPPKDFDVATDATPDQVHRIVRRSRLIGRRFKLVHAVFHDEIVEVSTFRSGEAAETDEHGRVLRDNVYGNREQDAARRDFTINALYYDPSTEQILDFHQGVEDLRKKVVRIIGDPQARFREDPVRMLRAVRFAAKLDFKIEPRTRGPIKELATLIENVPAARLFDEMQKLLLSGYASACLHRLRSEGLHHGLLPLLDVILEQPMGEKFVNLALEQTDRRIREDKGVSPAFLFAALLWHEVLLAWKQKQEAGERGIPALYVAMDEVLDKQTDKLAIPRRFTATMKEIWSLQPRFEMRSGRRPFGLLEHPRFRAAFDFLVLRAESGECPEEWAQWWERFQFASPEERQAMLTEPQGAGTAKRRRRRRRKTRDGEGELVTDGDAPDGPDGADDAPGGHGDGPADAPAPARHGTAVGP